MQYERKIKRMKKQFRIMLTVLTICSIFVGGVWAPLLGASNVYAMGEMESSPLGPDKGDIPEVPAGEEVTGWGGNSSPYIRYITFSAQYILNQDDGIMIDSDGDSQDDYKAVMGLVTISDNVTKFGPSEDYSAKKNDSLRSRALSAAEDVLGDDEFSSTDEWGIMHFAVTNDMNIILIRARGDGRGERTAWLYIEAKCGADPQAVIKLPVTYEMGNNTDPVVFKFTDGLKGLKEQNFTMGNFSEEEEASGFLPTGPAPENIPEVPAESSVNGWPGNRQDLIRNIDFSAQYILERADSVPVDTDGDGADDTHAVMGMVRMSSGAVKLESGGDNTNIAGTPIWNRAMEFARKIKDYGFDENTAAGSNWSIMHAGETADMRILLLRASGVNENCGFLYIEASDSAQTSGRISLPVQYIMGKNERKVVFEIFSDMQGLDPQVFTVGNKDAEEGFDDPFAPGKVVAAQVEAYPAPSLPNGSVWEGVNDVAEGTLFNEHFRRGINMGGMLESVEEGLWPDNGVSPFSWEYIPGYFKRIKEAGFDFVRLPIRWQTRLTAIDGVLSIDEEFRDEVKKAVDAAIGQDLGIIIDIHHFNEFDKDPEEYAPVMYALWEMLADMYQNYPPHLIFEVNNEPHDYFQTSNISGENPHITATERWNPYQNEVISIIRKTNPDRRIIVTGANYGDYMSMWGLRLPAADDNLILNFHYYQPMEFTHQGPDMGSGYPANTPWNDTPEQRLENDTAMKHIREWSLATGIPVLMGEFGSFRDAPMDSRVAYTKHIRETAEKYGISWCYWEFHAGFGIFDPYSPETPGDPASGVFREGLKEALVGIPVDQDTYGAGAVSGTVTYQEKDGFIGPFTRTEGIKVTGVSLDKDVLQLKTGETYMLQAVITPDNALDKSVTWTTTDSNVASVDDNGKVTAVGAGSANITVITTDQNKTAVCQVTVTAADDKGDGGNGSGDGNDNGNGSGNSGGNNAGNSGTGSGTDDKGKNSSTGKITGSAGNGKTKPAAGQKPGNSVSIPSTGDSTPVMELVIILTGSLICLFLCLVYRRKGGKKKNRL